MTSTSLCFFLFTTAFTSLALSQANYDPKTCGFKSSKYFTPNTYRSTESSTHKILNGEPVDMGEFPFSVFIKIMIEGKSGICSGTLISRRHVLTASHCFAFFDEDPFKDCVLATKDNDDILESTFIRIGGVCQEENAQFECDETMTGKTFMAKRIFVGPYVGMKCSEGRDIALIELAEAVDISVLPHICLPHRHNIDHLDNRKGVLLLATGIGSDPGKEGYADKPVPRLQKGQLGYPIAHKECNAVFRKSQLRDLPPGLICSVETHERNVCKGDSGGGVSTIHKKMGRMFVWGIVSFGSDCTKLKNGAKPSAQLNQFETFTICNMNTDVRYYSALIDDFMGERIEDRQKEWSKYETL
ncbi:hypothetical protein WR25_09061 [Diploscapter pachys]|uniref:Peptidase S1 domain-containing protein n=1 Tax=Diploscapter pachys TaxID=2018661 RepID=A0A2A2LAL0_9BILA|nr:hypothetical protein WR25_09061 [Diploscapter pachys]